MSDPVDPRAVIEVTGLVKDYRGLRPLRISSLVVTRGERVALSGLDAAAAEVFLNVLNGAIVPDEGIVRILGADTGAMATDSEWLAGLERFGVVTPRAVLLEGSTVAQNLALPYSLEIDPMPPDLRELIAAAAVRVALGPETLDRPIGECGPAVRARVHLARGLALDPEIVFLEHPTAGLSPDDLASYARDAAGALQDAALTIVALTEDAVLTRALGGRALRLEPGTGDLVPTSGWRRWWRGRT